MDVCQNKPQSHLCVYKRLLVNIPNLVKNDNKILFFTSLRGGFYVANDFNESVESLSH